MVPFIGRTRQAPDTVVAFRMRLKCNNSNIYFQIKNNRFNVKNRAHGMVWESLAVSRLPVEGAGSFTSGSSRF